MVRFGIQVEALATNHNTTSKAITPAMMPNANRSFCGLNHISKTAMNAKRYSRNSIINPPT